MGLGTLWLFISACHQSINLGPRAPSRTSRALLDMLGRRGGCVWMLVNLIGLVSTIALLGGKFLGISKKKDSWYEEEWVRDDKRYQ